MSKFNLYKCLLIISSIGLLYWSSVCLSNVKSKDKTMKKNFLTAKIVSMIHLYLQHYQESIIVIYSLWNYG